MNVVTSDRDVANAPRTFRMHRKSREGLRFVSALAYIIQLRGDTEVIRLQFMLLRCCSHALSLHAKAPGLVKVEGDAG